MEKKIDVAIIEYCLSCGLEICGVGSDQEYKQWEHTESSWCLDINFRY